MDADLVDLSKGEYVLTTLMPTKKDIVNNWTERNMCEDYHLMNK
jgi:hypothetical protein